MGICGACGYRDSVGVNLANCIGCGDQWDKTAPVGSFEANAWGVHDMHGNVIEWVQDCWNSDYEGAPADGSARESGLDDWRVVRGGSWIYAPVSMRSASRLGFPIRLRNPGFGFRVARSF